MRKNLTIIIILKYYLKEKEDNTIGKTGDLSRAPGAGSGLRSLGFRDRALGPRKPIIK